MTASQLSQPVPEVLHSDEVLHGDIRRVLQHALRVRRIVAEEHAVIAITECLLGRHAPTIVNVPELERRHILSAAVRIRLDRVHSPSLATPVGTDKDDFGVCHLHQ